MTRTVFICFSVILFTSYSIAKLTCGANMEVSDCPNECSSNYCPKNEDQAKAVCNQAKECPPPRCQCSFNYRFADNGTCIPTRECPPFSCSRPHEEHVPCPSYCPTDDCSQATPDGLCPYPGFLLTVECSPTCRCIRGYWRKNGTCVPYKQCPMTSSIIRKIRKQG